MVRVYFHWNNGFSINSLFQKNGMKQLTESEINRFITGAYTDSKEYGKRPLSKFVTDISRNIGLIGEKYGVNRINN